ncbi:hypothetical protein D3C74_314540 [compost metagenome]
MCKKQAGDEPEHTIWAGQRQSPIEQPGDILGKTSNIEAEEKQHRGNQHSVGCIGCHQTFGPFGRPAQVPAGIYRFEDQSAEHKEQRHPEPGQIMVGCRIAGVPHDHKNNTETLGCVNPQLTLFIHFSFHLLPVQFYIYCNYRGVYFSFQTKSYFFVIIESEVADAAEVGPFARQPLLCVSDEGVRNRPEGGLYRSVELSFSSCGESRG